MTSELKPCPFCGCEPIKQHNENKNHHSYECSSEESKKLCCMIMPMTHIYDSEKEAAHAWNTRAVPDVPELVRYSVRLDEGRYFGMAEYAGGKYVRHDQATEQLLISKNLSALQSETIVLLEKDVSDLRQRAEAVEAKLAQNEKQEPVAYTLIFRKSYGVNAETTFKKFEDAEKYAIRCELPLSSIIPLYAAPVASDEYLRAENERLREALKPFAAFANALSDNAPDDVALGLMAGGQISFGPSGATIGGLRAARAALNPSEPRT